MTTDDYTNNTSVTLHINTASAIDLVLRWHRLITGPFRSRCQCGLLIAPQRNPDYDPHEDESEWRGRREVHFKHLVDEVRKSLRLGDVLVVRPGEKVGLSLEEYRRPRNDER